MREGGKEGGKEGGTVRVVQLTNTSSVKKEHVYLSLSHTESEVLLMLAVNSVCEVLCGAFRQFTLFVQ